MYGALLKYTFDVQLCYVRFYFVRFCTQPAMQSDIIEIMLMRQDVLSFSMLELEIYC